MSEYSEAFEKFWQAYPRKVAKPQAFKTWQKNIEGDAFLPTMIVQDIEKRKRLRWYSQDKTKIPHASTWLNQRRWEDEGWEDDVKTRGRKDDDPAYVSRPMPEEGPDLPRWEKVLNRLARSYILHSGGLDDSAIKKMVAIKHETLKDLTKAIDEEIELSGDDREVVIESAYLLANTMLDRFDLDLGLNLKRKVLK
jgi:hypothetical protein